VSDTSSLYEELLAKLATSDSADRRNWGRLIAEQDVEMEALAPLLFAERNTAYRFSWLLSDIGLADPEKLFSILSYAFEKRYETGISDFEQQFVKYWRIAGIPEQHKGKAIDLMFNLLADPKVGTHIKSVSAEVLHNLANEYPELGNELRLCLQQELDKNTNAFRKKAEGILRKL